MTQSQRITRTDAANDGTRRIIERVASNVPAVWIAKNGNKTCRLVDVAPTGARLKVANLDDMPETFQMYVPDFQLVYDVQTRWRREGHVGVMFLRAWRKDEQPPTRG